MPKKHAATYTHDQQALLRPEAGAQDVAAARARAPAAYRYDSSLAPELCWDESAAAAEADQELQKILAGAAAASKTAPAEADQELQKIRDAALRLQAMRRPFLNWTGKAERAGFEVPSLPLFVHERLSARAILDTLSRHRRDRRQTLDLFGESGKSIGEKIRGAYTHSNGWQNRLILGDSLQVMNSLLEYEHLGGQVQMVYMDPPYGIKFGSNFQPYIRRRDVKDNDDAHITREPETVQAYRDTWTLGIHSWLGYMRDRLLLARELLADSGSCFVQISDEHVHYVRNIMDEVFGKDNFVSIIAYKTTSGVEQKNAPRRICDYIIWYAKNAQAIRFNRLFVESEVDAGMFRMVEESDGARRPMTAEEKKNISSLDESLRPYCTLPLHSRGAGNCAPRQFEGEKWSIPDNRHWSHTDEGFQRLVKNNRIVKEKTVIRSVSYHSDFSYKELPSYWYDTGPETDADYVVQTSTIPIQRCMLMTTDPGDLVFDPTCGSGTTAYVAEQWGRRWITTDVSRVPLSLARQRLLTAAFPYYKLKGEAPSQGFVYERRQNKKGEEVGGIVPHVTLKSIANDELPKEEVLVDKPEIDSRLVRTSGPFCVEAVMPLPLSPAAPPPEDAGIAAEPGGDDSYLPRMLKTLRLSPVIRLPGNKTITLAGVRPPAKSLNLHAEAVIAAAGEQQEEQAAIIFGPANAAIGERVIIEAAREAKYKNCARLLVIAFSISPDARRTVEDLEKTIGVPALYIAANSDLIMGDMLKNLRASQAFSVSGLPDIRLVKLPAESEGGGDGAPLYQVTLRGLDIYDPVKGEPESKDGADVPCWMLDTDYDGQCFRAGQVFFPRTAAWDNIRKSVQADFSDSVWQRLASDASEPFVMGEQQQIAVKVIDDRGNELMAVKGEGEAEAAGEAESE